LPFIEKILGSSEGGEIRFLCAIFVPLARQECGFFTNILEFSGDQDGRSFSVNLFSSGAKEDRFIFLNLFVWRRFRSFIDCHPRLSLKHDLDSCMKPSSLLDDSEADSSLQYRQLLRTEITTNQSFRIVDESTQKWGSMSSRYVECCTQGTTLLCSRRDDDISEEIFSLS
jgi:hypothetical protein